MTKTKYPIFKCLHRGEKGFTLIELLVVIAILGIIAAVVALNIGGFFGTGKEQAANTEAHQVQTAVTAAMAANNFSAGLVGPNAADPTGAEAYLMNPAQLQATYNVSSAGGLLSANLTATSQWSGCNFSSGQWSC
jgi:prepilin-type N-terminal cleavage/methylation domain-containing protein